MGLSILMRSIRKRAGFLSPNLEESDSSSSHIDDLETVELGLASNVTSFACL